MGERGPNSFWCLFFQARTFFISHQMVLTMEKMRATTVTTRKAPSTCDSQSVDRGCPCGET